MSVPGIEAAKLDKSYGRFRAVRNVSFTIDKSEVVGFLGLNGAGKTTTMRLLTTFLEPDSGTARISGYDILESPLEVRRRVGYLPENNPLYEEMSVIEYLEFVGRIRGLSSGKLVVRTREVLERCGLEQNCGKFIGELSRGYRQRVGLAQALLHDPDILIMDEPTTGLDPRQIVEIRDLISEIGREKTVLLSTHIMQEVEACCTRVIIINEGEIIEDGDIKEISARMHHGYAVRVVLTGDSPDLAEAFREIDLVREVISRGEGQDREYELICEREREARERIFETVKKKGGVMLELSLGKTGAEGVFLELLDLEKRERDGK